MQNAFTLLLANRAAILLQHFGASLEKAWLMPYGQESMHDMLGKVLLARTEAPLSIFLDQQSLEVKTDALPPVSSWQFEKILSRQRGFHFPQSDVAASRIEKRKEGAYGVHAAASLDASIQKTLGGLYHIANHVEPLGFYPLELLGIVRAIDGVPQHSTSLMLFLGEATGLRQIVIKDDLPVLSRLHTDCVPSTNHETLVREIAEHIKSTKDYLPRLDSGLAGSLPVLLFVPPMLKSLAARPELQQAGVQVIALEPPKPDLVPDVWALDLALLARLAKMQKRLLPFSPDWLKGRQSRFNLRQDVSTLMFVFGLAGIAFGLETLYGPSFFTNKKKDETEASASVAPVAVPAPVPVAAPPPEPPKPEVEAPKPPDLKLDALMYNSPQDWAVWINGRKYTPEDNSGPLVIEDVSEASVRVLWQQGESQKEYILKSGDAGTGVIGE